MSAMSRKSIGVCLLVAVFCLGGLTQAWGDDAKPWWPFPIEDWSSGKGVKVDYVPLEKASKK